MRSFASGHLAGAVSGVLFALLVRKKGPVSDATLFAEDTREELLPAWWAEAHPNHPDVIAQRSALAAQASDSGWTDIDYTLIPTSPKKPKKSDS